MEPHISPSPLSLYIHIPFCLSRCGYCSFFSLPFSRRAIPEYLGWLQREKALYPELLQRPLSTLYFGGGSPSLLSSQQINDICQDLQLSAETEITLEINPLQLSSAFLQDLRTTPVNRLSLGVQSMNNRELQWLNRKHKAEQVEPKLKLCRDFGYTNISLDLIYGLPEQDANSREDVSFGLDSLISNLEAYLALKPEHISCYLLSLDEDCLRYAEHESGQGLPDDESCALQYQTIRSSLLVAGYSHYEISNFALPGRESRHNLAYWQSREYLGLGAAASGWISPYRYTNPASLKDYYAQIGAGNSFPNKERCNKLRMMEDYLMMGLRLIEGIELQDFTKRFEEDIFALYGKKIEHLIKLGMLCLSAQRLALSTEALFISNSVIGELIL